MSDDGDGQRVLIDPDRVMARSCAAIRRMSRAEWAEVGVGIPDGSLC